MADILLVRLEIDREKERESQLCLVTMGEREREMFSADAKVYRTA